ncbi:Non-specific lipid-transfer protein-like protein family [Quillaja saponaria]|uniref:Non-specific lipid-transfer protein-like protein family n=1 Tax=Quillaja saponaria TaxID=32244 RepID=A0AAD7Q9G5_QUISA|nr:Non-specific lipid-transfer protein-like protein family [Quillaja saponaria]
MASRGIIFSLLVVLVAFLWTQTAAQLGCTSTLASLAPCLNFITGSSSTPSASCCSQLSNVVQSSPQCLCSVLNGGGAQFGITINQTTALSLPGACKVQTPPVSQCQAAAAPTTSAATPPTNSAATAPAGPTNSAPIAPTTSAASPEGSPAASPADSSDETPDAATTPSASDTPSGAGSKSVPSKDGRTLSNGSIVKARPHLLLFFLFLMSCASAVTKI